MAYDYYVELIESLPEATCDEIFDRMEREVADRARRQLLTILKLGETITEMSSLLVYPHECKSFDQRDEVAYAFQIDDYLLNVRAVLEQLEREYPKETRSEAHERTEV